MTFLQFENVVSSDNVAATTKNLQTIMNSLARSNPENPKSSKTEYLEKPNFNVDQPRKNQVGIIREVMKLITKPTQNPLCYQENGNIKCNGNQAQTWPPWAP